MRSALIAAAVSLLIGAGGATAATLITGAQIKDGTITSKDIHNGSIRKNDLAAAARGARGPAGPKGDPGAPGAQGATGPSAIYIDRTAATVEVAPGKNGFAILDCPHGHAVSIMPNIFNKDALTVSSVVPHSDQTLELNVRNNSADPIRFMATLTCVDTVPYD